MQDGFENVTTVTQNQSNLKVFWKKIYMDRKLIMIKASFDYPPTPPRTQF